MHDEARTWKAVAYDKIVESLQGASLGEACDYMMDASVRILVFENNEKAEEFAKVMQHHLRVLEVSNG